MGESPSPQSSRIPFAARLNSGVRSLEMSPFFRKILLVLAGLLIAAGITYYPWTYIDHFTGEASSVYGMSAVIWAPAALIIGIFSGAAFVFALWPRKPRVQPPAKPVESYRERSSFDA